MSTKAFLRLGISTGIGVLLGYSIFYTLWRQQCQDLLQKQMASLNGTTAVSTSSSSLPEYQELLVKHQETLRDLHKVQTGTVQELRDKIASVTTSADKENSELRKRLEWMESLVQKKVAEVQALESSAANGGTCRPHMITAEGNGHELYQWMRHRHAAQLALRYGSPPYEVEFTMDDKSIFMVTFSAQAVRDMPHTVFMLFDTLALMEGTSLVLSSRESSLPSRPPATLTRKYAQHGLRIDQILMNPTESSASASCNENGALGWWRGIGPYLQIVDNGSSKGDSFVCPGRVQDETVVTEMRNRSYGTPVILAARVVSPTRSDEL